MTVVGLVGYVETPRGLKFKHGLGRLLSEESSAASTELVQVEAQGHDEVRGEVDRRKQRRRSGAERIKKYCTVVRVIAHTQVKKLKLRQKKAHVMEIQVNGGSSVAEKVDYAKGLFEQEVPVDTVFNQGEMIDVGVTRGHGTEGS